MKDSDWVKDCYWLNRVQSSVYKEKQIMFMTKANHVTSLTENRMHSSHVAVSEWRKHGNQYQWWMYYTGTMLDTGSGPGRNKTSQGSRWSMAYVHVALRETSSCQDWFFCGNMGKISPKQDFILGFFMGIIVSSRKFIRTPNINFGCYSLGCCSWYLVSSGQRCG